MSIADKYRNQLETIHRENDVFAIIDDMLQGKDDTYTVREVKQLAIRVKELQQNEQS